MAAYNAECGEDVLLLQATLKRRRASDSLRLRASILGGVLGELKRDACGVFTELRHRLREPAIDGAVHQQVAEQEHEQGGRKAKDERTGEQARADAGSEQAALAVRVQLEDIAREQDQKDQQARAERLHERDRRIADTLQESLLAAPSLAQPHTGLELGSVYEAAWEDAQIGGRQGRLIGHHRDVSAVGGADVLRERILHGERGKLQRHHAGNADRDAGEREGHAPSAAPDRTHDIAKPEENGQSAEFRFIPR